MGQTAVYGFRHPESSDDLNVGAFDIQLLAQDVENHLIRLWAAADNPLPSDVGTGNGTTSGYEYITGTGDFTENGGGVFTYVGSVPRWFLATAGGVITVTGTLPGSRFSLLHNGTHVAHSRTNGTQQPHSIGGFPLLLNPLDTVYTEAWQPNGDANTATIADRYLRLVSL